MSELSSEDYTTALQDIDRFTASFPSDVRVPDTQYQKGRIQYILGKYEDSIKTLYGFLTSWPNHAMTPSSYYWIGENLYAVGRFDEARSIFNLVLAKYPDSVKREACVYRISLIDQTDKQDELLKLLKMSHEESLKIIEDYQRREKTYEQAITAYQKRISDMIKDTRLGELETQLGDEKVTNSRLLDKIATLEIQNAELVTALAMTGAAIPASAIADKEISSDINSTDPEKRKLALEALANKAAALKKMYNQIGTEAVK
jgi:tetratricopeptide (TPR) repeat protein